ncbi:MAG: phosphate/phosphite/phosphonate ABC transporter substrate-binding protein [Gaiellales bacterium]
MRAYAFLGDALMVYQSAVVDLVRERAGIEIDPLVAGNLDDLDVVAAGDPARLFLCGLPYVRGRDRGLPVQALAAPVSSAAPEQRPGYQSLLLGRPGLTGQSLDDLTDLRLAINSRDSMSGWVLPVGSGLPLERFASITPTGGHRLSMEALLRDAFDAAPIDSMLLAGELATTPALATLPVLAEYGPSPSPPVVLVGDDAVLAEEITAVLERLHQDDEGRAALALGRMARLERMRDEDYAHTRACDREAATCTR